MNKHMVDHPCREHPHPLNVVGVRETGADLYAEVHQPLDSAGTSSLVVLDVLLGATIVGGSFAGAGSELGLFVGVPALLATVAIGRWILKNWDY
jgi:hypothetical protein